MVAAAVVGSAVIGAGASAASASSSKKAANKATAAQQQAVAASNALQEKIYNQNTANLKPSMDRGNAAGDAMNALLLGDATQHQAAFDRFRSSTGYDFRLSAGLDALQSQAAARGSLRTGDTLKALQDYAQETASGEFGNYLGYLGNQQGVGLSAGSAIAGVGQGYANALTANNNNAANAATNNALLKSAANNQMWGGIASAGTKILGGLGTSYSPSTDQRLFDPNVSLFG